MSPRYWQILPAVAVLGTGAFAQSFSPGQRNVGIWTLCVMEAGKRFATGPDSAEFIISTAILACPKERAEAVRSLQADFPGRTADPPEARLQYQIAIVQQMDSFARDQIALTVAQVRSRQPPHK